MSQLPVNEQYLSPELKSEEQYAGMPLNQQALLEQIEINICNNYKKYYPSEPYGEFMQKITVIASNPNSEEFSDLYGRAHIDSNLRLYGINTRDAFLKQRDLNITIIALSLARAKKHHNSELAWPYIARAFFSMGRLQQISEYEQIIQEAARKARKSSPPQRPDGPSSNKVHRQKIILKIFKKYAPAEKWKNIPTAVEAVHSHLLAEFSTQKTIVEGKDLSDTTWFVKNIHKWTHSEPSFASSMSRFVSSLGSRKNRVP